MTYSNGGVYDGQLKKAKKHGHSVGRADAIRTIQRRAWLKYVRKEDLAEIFAGYDTLRARCCASNSCACR